MTQLQSERPEWQKKIIQELQNKWLQYGSVGAGIYLEEVYKLDLKWAKLKMVDND